MDGFPEYTVPLLAVGGAVLAAAWIPASVSKSKGKPWIADAVVSYGMAVVFVLDWAGYVVACDFHDFCAATHGLQVVPMDPPSVLDKIGTLAWLIWVVGALIYGIWSAQAHR